MKYHSKNILKKTARALWAMPLLMLATACSSDNMPDGVIPGNINANNSMDEHCMRIECPSIRDYNNFRARTTTENGKQSITYCMEHIPERKHSRWVAFTFDPGNRAINWKRDNWENTEWNGDPFQCDPDFAQSEVMTKQEINRTGYVRGHLVASYDRVYSKDANEQTFYYSNISPMLSRFNTGIWNDLEQLVQGWGRNSSFCDTLYIVKGGTTEEGFYKSTTKNEITCPTVPLYYYMALLCRRNDTYKGVGFWFQHKSTHSGTVADYAVSIDELEELTGIDFFCNLPDKLENSIEKAFYASQWKGL